MITSYCCWSHELWSYGHSIPNDKQSWQRKIKNLSIHWKFGHMDTSVQILNGRMDKFLFVEIKPLLWCWFGRVQIWHTNIWWSNYLEQNHHSAWQASFCFNCIYFDKKKQCIIKTNILYFIHLFLQTQRLWETVNTWTNFPIVIKFWYIFHSLVDTLELLYRILEKKAPSVRLDLLIHVNNASNIVPKRSQFLIIFNININSF